MAKGKKEREKDVNYFRHDLNEMKKGVLATGKFSRIVPKEHLNFDKNITVPKVESNGKDNKNNTNKDTNVKKETSSVDNKKLEVKGNIAVITGTEVRFRQDGNLNGKILGYFDKGEKVTILANENGWCKVQRQDGTVGYVSSDFCK